MVRHMYAVPAAATATATVAVAATITASTAPRSSTPSRGAPRHHPIYPAMAGGDGRCPSIPGDVLAIHVNGLAIHGDCPTLAGDGRHWPAMSGADLCWPVIAGDGA